MSLPAPTPSRSRRSGFSLIELLCIISILAVLFALILPAVQNAREASRRMACSNNLRQFGIALHSYVSGQGFFPAINSPTKRYANGVSISAHYYSPVVRMLPHVEQNALFNSVNFSESPSTGTALNGNHTAMTISLELFLCPSDNDASVVGFGRTSYRFNIGPSPWFSPFYSSPISLEGPFTTHKFYTPADFQDGLSQTIGVSERIQGDWSKAAIDYGDYKLLSVSLERGGKSGDADWAVGVCAAASHDSQYESRAGESWFLSGLHFTNYDHCAGPNASALDCSFDAATEGIHHRVMHNGVFSARSNHSGLVNTLAMDGSVHPVRNAIDLRIWRALATRNGSETFSADGF